MSNQDEFKPTAFTAGSMPTDRIAPDEQRLFSAHHQLALKGHPSGFPLRLQALLSAPFAVDQKGASGVKTMEIDTVVPLAVLPAANTTHVVTVRTVDEEGYQSHVQFSRLPDGSALRSRPDYESDFASQYEYARAAVLEWAQSQFSAGVTHMAQSQMFDRIAFDRLKSGIREGVEKAVESLVYIARPGTGAFLEKSPAPRFVFEETDWDYPHLAVKLAGRGTDPMSEWAGRLASLPVELGITACRLRYVVMNAVGTPRWAVTETDQFGMDDLVFKRGIQSRKDQVDLADVLASELKTFVVAVKSMARDIVETSPASATFSGETLAIASLLSSINVGAAVADLSAWGEKLESFSEAVADDADAFKDFLKDAGWKMSYSPALFMRAKFNLLTGNDLSLGLYEPQETAPAKGRRP